MFRRLGAAALLLLIGLLAACAQPGEEKYKMTDAQLGLNAQQAHGRHIYATHCLNCHESYTDQKRQSFPLKGISQKQFLPSGVPNNDDRLREILTQGKRMMPPARLSDEDLSAVIAYLHTL